MLRRLVPLVIWVALTALAAAGCQTTPASPEAVPAPGPASIAWAPGATGADGWTTPERPEPPTLRRSDPSAGGLHDPLTPYPPDQDGRGGPGTGAERRLEGDLLTGGPWEVYFHANSLYLLPGELSNRENGIGTWINRFRLSVEKPMDYFGRIGLNATYAHRRYFFEGSNSLVAGTDDPWEDVHILGLGANIFQPVSEQWAVLLSANLSASAEVGADLADALAWAVTLGAGFRASEKLDLGGGVFVAGRFEEDLLFFGGPQFAWRPIDKWKVELLGPQLSLTYRPDETWEYGLFGGFNSVRFRLKEEAPGNSQIVTDSRLPIYLQLRYTRGKKTEIEFRAGLDVYRDIVVEDAQGKNGVGVRADPSPFFGLRWIQIL